MWLLNSHTQELNEVISHRQAPPYAILSHTWGNEEVSFREWKRRDSEEVRKKEGFHKIISLCQQAAADGHEWVWVDTCCIDKRSSAELSEAINSMFQWYSNAAVCYVYLFDVSDRNNKFDVANTRWVTRGWTLQELIAPREVIFLSSTWKKLGTRSELAAHLADATGIDEPFLSGRSIHEASIAQRMSWAASRTTSREEDMAYCLLGIFDVNMSLIYGEGLKAFRRLQELLIREYPEDHSLFAWGKIVNRPSNAVDDKEQLWGSKPVSYDPNQADRGFFGLLAERPKDFSDCGQIIRAPNSTRFFQFERVPSASGLSRSTIDVQLPVLSNYALANIMPVYVAIHLKRPPIVQIMKLYYIIFLCGQWNKSHTEFQYSVVPVLWEIDWGSRMNELMACSELTINKYDVVTLRNSRKKFSMGPESPLQAQSGDMVMRKCICKFEYSFRIPSDVNMSNLNQVFTMPPSFSSRIYGLQAICSPNLGLSITIGRLDALDHSHEDPMQARTCGRLRLGLYPFYLSPPAVTTSTSLSISQEQGASSDHATIKERFTPRIFSSLDKGYDFACNHWGDMKYKRDMAVPRDEWRISIIGIADIRVSVERIYFGEDDDNDSNGDGVHRFVDVLDIMVDRNTDEDTSDKDTGDEDTSDTGTDGEAANENDTDDENVMEVEESEGGGKE